MSGLLPLPWRDRPTIMLLALQMYDNFSYAQEKFWVATLQLIYKCLLPQPNHRKLSQ